MQLSRTLRTLAVAVTAAGLALTACSDSKEPAKAAPAATKQAASATPQPAAKPSPPAATPTSMPTSKEELAKLAEQGRADYMSTCIACHNADPTKDGALGPAIAGSSYELIEARVMRAEYPPGYTPKRETRVMVAMPFLEKQLPALAAYLAPMTRD